MILEILSTCSKTLLSGFAIFAIATSGFPKIKNRFEPAIDHVAAFLVIFGGLCFGLSWLGQLVFTDPNSQLTSLSDRMAGPYGLRYWSYLLSFLIFTQMFWVPRIRKSRWVKLPAGLVFLYFLFYEDLVIMITTYHREFMPSSGHGIGLGIIYQLVIDVLLFLLVLYVGTAIFNRKTKFS